MVGVPGYVVPTDLDAALFVRSPSAITGITSYPAGALDVTTVPGKPGWTRLSVRGRQWGRARLTLTYADGQVQTVQYFVTKPLEQTMADLGASRRRNNGSRARAIRSAVPRHPDL